jgi:hypothetical protein
LTGKTVSIPLRGYVVCNVIDEFQDIDWGQLSQSPYGAKWFATALFNAMGEAFCEVAIPLRG